MLSAVRIQPGDSHRSVCHAEALQRPDALFCAGNYIFLCDLIQHIPQRQVAGQEKDAQAIGLEHGKRVFGACQSPEDLGMPDKWNFGCVQRLFVDRRRRNCCRLAVHRKFNAFCNIGIRSFSAHGLHFSVFKN